MVNVEPVQQESFLCSFCAVMEATSEGLSASISASTDIHRTI